MQGISALATGIIVAFCYGWNMAMCGLVTALILVIAQSSVAQYLKFRGQKDVDSAIEASRAFTLRSSESDNCLEIYIILHSMWNELIHLKIVTESISNIRTIQALCKESYMFQAYCAAAREPHRRAMIRGLWQSLSLALANSFVMLNFAVAYAFGLWLVKNGWSTPFTVFQKQHEFLAYFNDQGPQTLPSEISANR